MTPSQKWLLLLDAILLVLYKNANLPIFLTLILMAICNLVSLSVVGKDKRYSKTDQHLAQHFEYNSACLSSPPPFLCSQIITPFLNQ